MIKKTPISKEEKILIKKSVTVFGIALFAVVAAEAFNHPHAIFALEMTPAFYALFGFLSCVAIVLFSKWVGKIVKRDEDYYDNKEDN